MEETKLNLNWVTDIINDDFKKWNKGDGVFINCQTGTGKSYFIEHPLLRHCIDNKKTMLYLCNRINLKSQVKYDIAEAQGIELIDKSVEAVEKLEQIGLCTIMTYHKIQNYKVREIYRPDARNELIDSYYDYIILDEVQYINHDSSFVGKIQYFYHYLSKVINNSTLIYLSANMDEVKEDILGIYRSLNNTNIITYDTGRDYSYVTVFYFNKYEDIINTINNDISGNKWMIYINSIDKAKELQEKINDCKFICSKTNGKEMDKEVLDEIIRTQRFSCKCVIATKALDNGINIKDNLLTNMVIITLNKIDFIQMLGRKRIDIDKAQNVNLYILTRSKKTFTALLNMVLNKHLEMVLLHQFDYFKFCEIYNDNHKKLPEHLFYQQPSGGWNLNDYGYKNLSNQIIFCEQIIEQFKSNKLSFIFYQLNLLGLLFDNNNWIINVQNDISIDDINQYLQNIIGKKLYKEHQQELIDKIDLRDSRNRQQKSIEQFNAYFIENEMPYRIESKIDNSRKNHNKTINFYYKKTYWIVGKINYN